MNMNLNAVSFSSSWSVTSKSFISFLTFSRDFFVFEKLENNHTLASVLFSPIHNFKEEFRDNQLLISINCTGSTQRMFPVKYMFR